MILATHGIVGSQILQVVPVFEFSVKTDNAGVSTSTEFRMPLTTSTGLDFDVDWGDGSPIENITDHTLAIHDYGTAGTYTINVTGSILGWSFNNGGDRLKMLDVKQWAGLNISANVGFNGCSNLTASAVDAPLITTTSLSSYFRRCSNFNGAVGNWDISNVTDMSFMFREATSFNNAGNDSIKNWNTSAVTNMTQVFDGDNFNMSFNQPLNWDVSNVTNMSFMFRRATAFNQNIGSWNTGNVTNMSSMFNGATAFNQNIGAWNTSAVTNMSSMFSSASAFNQNIGAWDVSKVTNFSSMFQNNTAFNNGGSSNINNWIINTTSNVTMRRMFSSASAFNQNIGSWNVSNVTDLLDFMAGKTAANYSASNLDSIYNGWSSLASVKPNLSISFGTIKYTASGVAGRLILTSAPNNWTITDGGI